LRSASVVSVMILAIATDVRGSKTEELDGSKCLPLGPKYGHGQRSISHALLGTWLDILLCGSPKDLQARFNGTRGSIERDRDPGLEYLLRSHAKQPFVFLARPWLVGSAAAHPGFNGNGAVNVTSSDA
jgi:hypothetical protein